MPCHESGMNESVNIWLTPFVTFAAVKRYTEKQVMAEIEEGNEDILTYLAHKYFPSSRKYLRRNGFRDKDTPAIFSEVLLETFVSLTGNSLALKPLKNTQSLSFREYFFNMLKEFADKRKKNRTTQSKNEEVEDINNILSKQQTAAKCVEVLDGDYQKLLYARVVKKMRYEKIAQLFNYSNAVIAQYEFNKACNQLQAVIDARLGGQQNDDTGQAYH
jgi:hypothetical protein